MCILIVEDDPFLALELSEVLGAALAMEVEVRRSLADAAGRPAASARIAVLDVDLGDGKVFPVADRLAAQGVPFLFLTGSRRQDLPERFRERPHLPKPYHERTLVETLRRSLA